MTIRVLSTYFVDISKIGSGGAIEISEKKLFVSFCCFTSLSVTVHGGSIHCENAYCKIAKSCFYASYTSAHQNDVGIGNAVYALNGYLYIDNINTRKCGPSSSQCSDSSIRTDSCQARAVNYNASSSYGVGGGAGIAINFLKYDSFVRFMNVVDAHDDHAIESTDLYTAFSCNFVNTKGCNKAVLWLQKENRIKFDTCIFIETKSPFSSSNIAYLAVNCISDVSLASMECHSSPKTIFITIKLINICTINRHNSRSSSIMLLQLIIFLSIK